MELKIPKSAVRLGLIAVVAVFSLLFLPSLTVSGATVSFLPTSNEYGEIKYGARFIEYPQADGTKLRYEKVGPINVYEDGGWKDKKDARSLKDKEGFSVNINDDGTHLVNIVDFNFTSIEIEFSYDENNLQEFDYEVEDGKMKTKFKILEWKLNELNESYLDETEYEIEIEEGSSESFVYQGNPFGKIFQFGENTTIWEYQENYDEVGSSGDWTNVEQAYDGTWETSATAGGPSYIGWIYVNYTKPEGAESTSLWQVKDGSATVNLTITQSCWDYNVNKILFRIKEEQTICLNEDTEILTPQGIKKIKDIQIGDVVYSYNEKLKTIEEDEVTKILNFNINDVGSRYYYIYYGNGVVKSTGNHPFFVDGEFIRARNLKVGDRLIDINLEEIEITKIDIVENYEDDVFNFQTVKNHNFFANGVLVHNLDYSTEWYCQKADTPSYDELRRANPPTYEEAMWWEIEEPDPCAYDTGDWNIDCSDNCVNTGAVDVGGNDITIEGTGTFYTSADIVNYGTLTERGTDSSNRCVITEQGGGFRG